MIGRWVRIMATDTETSKLNDLEIKTKVINNNNKPIK